MKRKLVKQGAATLMVSLPSKWAKEHHLGKGDEIVLEEEGARLVISPGEDSKKSETTVEVPEVTERLLRVAIWNAYRTGYARIKVKPSTDQAYKFTKEILSHYLIGFDITGRTKEEIIIENITEPAADQFDTIFRKIFFNCKLLIQVTKERLQGEKPSEEYKDIVNRIHQYDNFCRRVLTKKHSQEQLWLWWSFLSLLIHGQREIYHLHRYLDQKKAKGNTNLLDTLTKMLDLLEKMALEKTLSPAKELYAIEEKTIFTELYTTFGRGEGITSYHLGSAIRQWYLAASPLIALAMTPDQK